MAALAETQPPQPAPTLRVHGGGMTSTAGIHPDFEELDSHILDAAPRARLSEEERLAREVIRRREAELERRARIFDAKRRQIGVDKEMLDAQIAEKAQRREAQQQQERAGDHDTLRTEKMLKLAEADKRRARRAMEQDCREFSISHLNKEAADTFDLNDKFAVRKGTPTRLGDDDHRLGAASMQKFSGEDLMKEERTKQQRMAQVHFIEQQKFEKQMLHYNDKEEERQQAQETAEVIELRNQVEAGENDLRRQLEKHRQDTNLQTAADRADQRDLDREMENATNAAEIDFHTTGHFLTETGPHFLESGRMRRDAFKGSTREERIQVRGLLENQAGYQQYLRDEEKYQDKMYASQVEKTRRQLVLMDREKQRMRRSMAEQVARENGDLKAQQHEATRVRNEAAKNHFSEDFFSQFNKGTR